MSPDSIRFLSLGEVLYIHENQIELYGGSPEVWDTALLESALAQPSATYCAEFLHEGLFLKAAAYLFHICQNHPFADGNMRTALAAALVFLDLNGVDVADPEEKLFDLVVATARGEVSKEQIAATLQNLKGK